ncbi:hypothetical protein QBC35DRAFT_525237 [Podospora australis]|uniref:Uncharacterized protein n=1 Tax=Podospora australis TaxID=1536484 RepID=A0AAN6WP88_9PEZI|nr:hypothetical protein QBC35DRAFT_525237 [Podospora australis]
MSPPTVPDWHYSREVYIAAFQGYYRFLAEMYLDESTIMQPPASGWPSTTVGKVKALGKYEEVALLLRHLPYVRKGFEVVANAQDGQFANWQELLAPDNINTEWLLMETEGLDFQNEWPGYVIGLFHGGEFNPIIFLHTEQGSVHWYECPEEFRHDRTQLGWVFPDELLDEELQSHLHLDEREDSQDPGVEVTGENEGAREEEEYDEDEEEEKTDAEHVIDGTPMWTVTNFFEMFKDQFRKLNWIPVSPERVISRYDQVFEDRETAEAVMAMARRIYHQHGWPDLQRCHKQECLGAIKEAMETHFPDIDLSIRE